jgi:hypothetical protein
MMWLYHISSTLANGVSIRIAHCLARYVQTKTSQSSTVVYRPVYVLPVIGTVAGA